MAANSKIEWTDHTVNFWIGCTKVSPACDHCYAERDWAMTGRHKRVEWGPHGARSPTKDPMAQLRSIAAGAARRGRRERVFVNSLSDWADNHKSIAPAWRAQIFEAARLYPGLDFLLLTKRPQNIAGFLPGDWGAGYPNVWIGTTVENQEEAERRIPHLLATPAKVRFVSAEPLLSRVDFLHLLGKEKANEKQAKRDVCLSVRSEWRHRDSRGRNDLEASETGMGSMEERGDQPSMQAGPGRAQQRAIFPSQSNAKWQARGGIGAPHGMATLQRPDSRRNDDQPPQRHQEGQSTRELRTGDPSRTANPRDACAESGACMRSTWAKQQHGQTDAGPSLADQTATARWRGAEVDICGLWGDGPDNLQDRQRTATIDLIIVGGESGPGARPMRVEWAQNIVAQCRAAGVACFVKQLSSGGPRPIKDMALFPDDLRVREMPNARKEKEAEG